MSIEDSLTYYADNLEKNVVDDCIREGIRKAWEDIQENPEDSFTELRERYTLELLIKAYRGTLK